jgi:aspartate carbamoyltransferase catalytic subunit
MSASELRAWLGATAQMERQPERFARALEGRVVANLFFEDSTRTRLSFTIAAKRLGGDAIDLLGSSSSVNKGETLIDTACNIEAMGVAALVVRAKQSGAASLIAGRVGVPVLNAGDGRHEHPTQGLLDVYTLANALGRAKEWDLAGLRVAIVGDVSASRVARSDIAALTALGAQVVCVGSPSLAPKSLASLGAVGGTSGTSGVQVEHALDPLLPTLDAIIMLRIQFERYDAGDAGKGGKPAAGASNVIASVREYREQYALTEARASRLPPHCIVMHPGPINRGIELDAEVADGPRSVILRQVSNGVLVRMAALHGLVVGG